MSGLGYKEDGGVTRDEGFELYSEFLGVRGYAALCDLIVPVGATTLGRASRLVPHRCGCFSGHVWVMMGLGCHVG